MNFYGQKYPCPRGHEVLILVDHSLCMVNIWFIWPRPSISPYPGVMIYKIFIGFSLVITTIYSVSLIYALEYRNTYSGAMLIFYISMIWYGIPMLWYAISMLYYEIFKNDMISYAIVWYAMLWYPMLWDLNKRSFFHRTFFCISNLRFTGLTSL